MKTDKHLYEQKFKKQIEKLFAKSSPDVKYTIAVVPDGVDEGSIIIAADDKPLRVKVMLDGLEDDALQIGFFRDERMDFADEASDLFGVYGLSHAKYGNTNLEVAVTVVYNYLLTGLLFNREKLYANNPTLALALEDKVKKK